MSDHLRILFTEGASLSARQTLYPLGPHHEIDVLDPDPLCQCRFSSFVRRFFRSPSFSDQPTEFLNFLARLLRSLQYDVLIPTHEQVYLLSRYRDSFSSHVGLALPDFKAMELLQNKAHFSRLLSELGLPQPETVILRRGADLDRGWKYPFYLKLAHSTAGGGVFHIEDRHKLLQKIDELCHSRRLTDDSELLVQQPGRGVLSTVQAVFCSGEVVGVHCFEARRLGVGGMSTARISVDHPVVREHVERIGRHLAWHGAFFIDYFYDSASGQPEYIEANPRIGETVNAMLSGLNLPQLLVQVSRGESPSRAPLGRFGVQTHNILMILMSMAWYGAGRRTLIRELRRWTNREDVYQRGEDELTRPQDDCLSIVPFLGVVAQLLAWPRLAKGIVAKTVDNYSLPESATDAIKALPVDLLNQFFS